MIQRIRDGNPEQWKCSQWQWWSLQRWDPEAMSAVPSKGTESEAGNQRIGTHYAWVVKAMALGLPHFQSNIVGAPVKGQNPRQRVNGV